MLMDIRSDNCSTQQRDKIMRSQRLDAESRSLLGNHGQLLLTPTHNDPFFPSAN